MLVVLQHPPQKNPPLPLQLGALHLWGIMISNTCAPVRLLFTSLETCWLYRLRSALVICWYIFVLWTSQSVFSAEEPCKTPLQSLPGSPSCFWQSLSSCVWQVSGTWGHGPSSWKSGSPLYCGISHQCPGFRQKHLSAFQTCWPSSQHCISQGLGEWSVRSPWGHS